jgi:hypothetical protein
MGQRVRRTGGGSKGWEDLRGAPMNYGEDIYEGAGGYAGLVYHEFVVGGDVSANISGWIEEKP